MPAPAHAHAAAAVEPPDLEIVGHHAAQAAPRQEAAALALPLPLLLPQLHRAQLLLRAAAERGGGWAD